MHNNRFLALVPARGGSKRLPRKNLLPLKGKPLIEWTINVTKLSGRFSDILVSTDDEEIAQTARSIGGLVPWLRPAELSSDTATSIDVVLHALDWYEKQFGAVCGVVLLQPTSPFRSVETIHNGLNRFIDLGCYNSVVSVSEAESHPAWTFYSDGSKLRPVCGWEDSKSLSQDLQKAYTLNGLIYISSPKRLRLDKSFIAEDMKGLIIEDYIESLDIDTAEDLRLAEYYAEKKRW
jgi:CMP-N,N'-diacetyllegionaminic acid synthase